MTSDVIQFVPKANLDRDAMIRQARLNYERIFPDTLPGEYVATEKLLPFMAPESDPA